jgi:hypothetical protein
MGDDRHFKGGRKQTKERMKLMKCTRERKKTTQITTNNLKSQESGQESAENAFKIS